MNFKRIITNGAAVAALALCSISASAGMINVWGEMKAGNNSHINNFYNGLAGHSSTNIQGQLDSHNLDNVDLLWATQPVDSYTGSELNAMAAYLSTGGRIAFMGEHGTYSPAQNGHINSALSFLGAGMQIQNSILDGGFHNATRTGGQILNHDLTAGVDTYNYAAFAPLVNLSGNAEQLMLGLDKVSVMMAFENIGAGSIFLITDQNVWDNVGSASNDNARMFENLVTAKTGAPVLDIPEPSTFAILALGLIGLSSRRFIAKNK